MLNHPGREIAKTEDVTWMSDGMFFPLKTLCPDVQNQLFGTYKQTNKN